MKSKSLVCTKIPQKNQNLSKIVRGALFGTSSSRHQIVSSRDSFLKEVGHPFRGGTVNLSQFGH